jgi:hypothetical protein
MASSKLLKEAIADAKAVRETAIANAKIALEEAFTPRLQSILSKKLQAEMDGEEEEADITEDNDISTGIGTGDNKQPADKANSAQPDLSGISKQSGEPGSEVEDYDKVKDLTEGEEEFETDDVAEGAMEFDSEEEAPAMEGEEFEKDSDSDDEELDLASIIRELEAQIAGEEGEEAHIEEPAVEGEEAPVEEPVAAEPTEEPAVEAEEPAHDDEEIDLDEILREMGYGEDEEEVTEAEEANHDEEKEKLQSELAEAISTIKSLKGTINEVNLLNAKLLYANKLFRSYNLTNEQKVKVVENLDRTSNVREVKLVYATLAESMKFTGTERKVAAKKTMTEGFASKPQATTAPKKEIISESNELANRFKQLAGIIK